LQKVAGEALEKQIEYLQRTAKEGQGKKPTRARRGRIGREKGRGAGAGELPSYDLGTYSKNYARAFRGRKASAF
jgi:hypothetical protein